MEDICNFIPPKKYNSDINYYHFVYEGSIKKLSQPFVHSNYYAILVFRGSAELTISNTTIPIKSGTLFFTFPYQSYCIENYDDFSYLYISFNGDGVSHLLKEFNISKENFLYENFSHIIEFWINSIRRINRINANTLTESVLMYTLSFINTGNQAHLLEQSDKFNSILEYINHNYTSKDISVKKVADIFFYSEKYLSSLFAKRTGVKFTTYINNLRIKYAIKLIENGQYNVADIASDCGYTDPFYFSKVFKKITGKSPTEYIKNNDR